MTPPHWTFVYTKIGRGHPFYLDGTLDALQRRLGANVDIETTDVFAASHGTCRTGWKLVRGLYRRGSSPGVVATLYARLRRDRDYNRTDPFVRLLGRDLPGDARVRAHAVVVAHPLLVAILRDHARVYYQHGEVVAPGEARIRGAAGVLVPTEHVAAQFREAGYPPDRIHVTGLCIEEPVRTRSESAHAARMERLRTGQHLTGGFFSSGAEPRHHVIRLVEAAFAAATAGGRVRIFAREGGRLARAAQKRFGRRLQVEQPSAAGARRENADALICLFSDRPTECGVSGEHFGSLDYFVAPSHERTHWALGLGIPMFVVEPAIGPFAPLNRATLLEAGVAELLNAETATTFGEWLTVGSRRDRLLRMAERGWKRRPTDGFDRSATALIAAEAAC